MKKNMGTIDRVVRVAVAVTIVLLYAAGQITGTAAVILGILAGVFLVSGFVGTCPLYLTFGWSTVRVKRNVA